MRYPVILAGGGGTRLWPASTEQTPKQFLPLGALPGESLIGATIRRLRDIPNVAGPIVVTGSNQIDGLRAALPDLPDEAILGEPARRNTAAALGLAAVHLLHRDADAIMAALPADHHIANEPAFAAMVTKAFDAAEQNAAIVTIGIEPSRPETGFGYIRLADTTNDTNDELHRVDAFVEKPNAETAANYVDSGRYLWNAGMFFFRAAHLMDQLQQHMPDTHAGLRTIAEALAEGGVDAAATSAQAVYPDLPSISIDYGVMERASNVLTFRGDFGWNDVGSWTALADYRPKDDHGNVTSDGSVLRDAQRNIIVSDAGTTIAAIGVSDLIIVQCENRILVVPRDRAQDVGALAKSLTM